MLTAKAGYEFASGVTATVNGQNATSVKKNADETITVTYTFPVTDKAKLTVGAPTFAPVAGTYTENQTVTLSSSTDGATIYYTTDGTTPTTGSHVYSGAISVTGTAGQSISTTIKAIAVKDGMQTSSVTSATYVIELPAPVPTPTCINSVAVTEMEERR